MSIKEKVEDYKKTLELFPNDQEKYQYLIEQAKKSDEFPEEFRKDSFKVHGCQSQVWLVPEQKEEKLLFLSDSDALISKGLVTLISSIYSNETAEEISDLLYHTLVLLSEMEMNPEKVWEVLRSRRT